MPETDVAKTAVWYDSDEIAGVFVYCQGCSETKLFRVSNRNHEVVWGWNGSLTKPTFNPSLGVRGEHFETKGYKCHSFVTDGQWHYLSDCTHELAGKTVDLIPVHLWPE